MESHPRPSLILLLLCIALFTDAAQGQSLSIIKEGESEFLIKGAAPPDTRYVLQASGNLRLWADINDEVSGQVSHRVDIDGVTQRFFRLTPWTPPAPPIRLVILGDSTVGDGTGWGTRIHGYFKPTVQIVNLAWPNMSTSMFLTSEQMPKLRAIKPEFVIAQFGWIDAGGCDGTLRCRTTLQEYADNLKTIVQAIRGFDGTPILITPTDPRVFDDTGKVVFLLRDYVAITKDVATQLQVHLIDLNQLTHDLYNGLGESGSAYISRAPNDPAHYSQEGAQIVSGLLVNSLPDSLGPYLVENLDQAP